MRFNESSGETRVVNESRVGNGNPYLHDPVTTTSTNQTFEPSTPLVMSCRFLVTSAIPDLGHVDI